MDGPVAQLEGGANACHRAQWKRSPLFESVVIVGLRGAVEDSPLITLLIVWLFSIVFVHRVNFFLLFPLFVKS